MMAKPIDVALLVINALEALGVPYLIGGSLAGAVHGVARATLDVDLVADLRAEQAQPLAGMLGGAFYVDVDAIREAIRSHGCFNAIHLETMFKVDVFIPRGRPYDRAQFEHRVRQVVSTEPERTVWVASAEDTILTKLEWYRQGGGASERQWRDVLGVVMAQGERLDVAYLSRWAPELHVRDLLERALAEGQT